MWRHKNATFDICGETVRGLGTSRFASHRYKMAWGELGPRLASDVDDEADGDVFVSAVGPPSVTTKYDTQVVSEGTYNLPAMQNTNEYVAAAGHEPRDLRC